MGLLIVYIPPAGDIAPPSSHNVPLPKAELFPIVSVPPLRSVPPVYELLALRATPPFTASIPAPLILPAIAIPVADVVPTPMFAIELGLIVRVPVKVVSDPYERSCAEP